MKVTQKELNDLQKIERLFGEIDKIYSGFSAELQENLHNMHNYEGSLGYCVRWGLQATSEIVEECEKDTPSVIEDFIRYCREQAEINNKKYSAQHEDKFMVIDKTFDCWRDDCDKYDYAAEQLIDEYPEWFYDCETIEDCKSALEKEYKKEIHGHDDLGDEQDNLSYGAAILSGKTILEFGSIGRWNGDFHGLNPLTPKNIGELLKSNHEQWMCYVDKETGEFCKIEVHHDGTNFYKYRELTCDWDEFEEILENRKDGGLNALVEKYSAPIGWRIAEVYGWDMKAPRKTSLDAQIQEAEENAPLCKQEKGKQITFDGR